jgi:hypothetical protein
MTRSYYAPLSLAILLGLAISMIASSPVYGDNVASCQGSGSSNAKVILAGRVITPSTLLRTANGQPCASDETGLNLVSMLRTVVVSPDGTPTQNGTALLAAMDTISNANPSSANPWLLKLEPGNYDLGNGALTLKPYVDLEGSGEATTIISSTIGNQSDIPTQATLVMASNSEVRFVTLVNSGAGDFKTALLVGSSVTNSKISYLTTSVSGGAYGYGLFNDGGSVTVRDSTLKGSGSIHGYGLFNTQSTAVLKVQNSTLRGDNSDSGYGLYNSGGIVTVQNSSLIGTGSTYGYGLYNTDATAIVQSSSLNGNGKDSYGLYNDAATTNLQDSTVSGSGSNYGFGIWNTLGTSNIYNVILSGSGSNYGYGLFNDSGTSNVHNSALSGSGSSASSSYGFSTRGGPVRVGASQLSGLVNISSPGTAICVGAYNANYTALNSSCS